MRILITGANGQLGLSLRDILPEVYDDLILTDLCPSEGVDTLDIADEISVHRFLDSSSPDVVINTAAMTNVDRCQVEPEVALRANLQGPHVLASATSERAIPIVHISTDFVFDGAKRTPYIETDSADPQSVYGQTKLLGERDLGVVNTKHYILRTAWLYSQFGRNFVKTMVELAQTKPKIPVVNDQIGSPTNAKDLTVAILTILEKLEGNEPIEFGTYHFANSGEASWFDLAKRTLWALRSNVPVLPQSFEEYKASKSEAVIAPRPAYSVLDCNKISTALGWEIRPWEEALADCMFCLTGTW